MTMHESSRADSWAHARRAARQWVDPYRPQGKLHPAICTVCGASEWHGRWRWGEAPPDLPRVLCPACERLRDKEPAHVIELTGALQPWWREVHGMIGNVARAELAEHPLERVMAIDVRDDRVLLPTTGLHIARRLVAAIVRRFRRGVRLQFADGTTTVDWHG